MKKVYNVVIIMMMAIVGTFHCLQGARGLGTLTLLQRYAKQMPEYPDPDNDDPLNPDYTSFHESYLPSFWGRVIRFFGFKDGYLWSAGYFKTLMKKVTKQRELNGQTGRFIEKFTPKTGSKFIIFGDIQGAYHSLVRDLTELHRQEVIDEKLKLINPNHYIIFNGDLIDRSPFILETLSVAMELLYKNPGNVFYIRGNHEDKQAWHNHGLKLELISRAYHLAHKRDKEIPLNHLVAKFFNTLSLALFLQAQDADSDEPAFVRISHYKRDQDELDEKYLGDFLHEPDDGKSRTFKLAYKRPSEKEVDIKVIIKGESRVTTFRPTPGLELTEAEKGATSWTLLSSPTQTYRTLYDFFFDAFAIVTVGKTIDDWIIELHNRDVRDLADFSLSKRFNFVTAEDITYEKSPEELEKKELEEEEAAEELSEEEEIERLLAQIEAAKKEAAALTGEEPPKEQKEDEKTEETASQKETPAKKTGDAEKEPLEQKEETPKPPETKTEPSIEPEPVKDEDDDALIAQLEKAIAETKKQMEAAE